ncbi:MAG: polysaccharide deacetylase family protein [Chitinophagaceae bacterium]
MSSADSSDGRKWFISIAFVGLLMASCNAAGTNVDTISSPVADTTSVIKAKTVTPQPQGATYVYLSFDDGPQPGTMACYKICKSLGVPATFYMIGIHLADKRSISWYDSVRMEPGFLIANHSNTHAFRNRYTTYYANPDSALSDFMKADQRLQVPYKIARFPGNNAWALQGKFKTTKLTRALAHAMDSVGYKVIGWDVEWRFKGGDIPVQSVDGLLAELDAVVKRNELFTEGHIVILAHDRMFRRAEDAAKLKTFIEKLQARNYIFATMDQYPGVKK